MSNPESASELPAGDQVAAGSASVAPPTEPPKRENIWINLALNVVIPSLLMTKGKDWFGLEPKPLLVLALAFPACYGIYDFLTRGKYNFFSILGFVSTLITGGVGLLELDKDWIAVKEAGIPALFAIAVLVSLFTPFPLIRSFLFNPEIFDVPKIDAALAEKGKQGAFEQLMKKCTLLLAGSFILSAVLNYGLAKKLIQHDPKTENAEFVEDMGRMTAWSYPVIMVPSMAIMMVALFKLANGIEDFTGFHIEDVMHIGKKEEKDEDEDEDGDKDEKNNEPEARDEA